MFTLLHLLILLYTVCVYRYTNTELVMKYAHWALERDEVLATKIFTEREETAGGRDSEVLSPHRVLDYLKEFPVATVSYLEHIIRNKGSKVHVDHCVYTLVCC